MRRKAVTIFIFIGILSLALIAKKSPAAFAANTSQLYWGAWINSNNHSTTSPSNKTAPFDYVSETNPGILGTFESRTGKKVSIIHWGSAWQGPSGSFNNFSTVQSDLDKTRSHGAIGLLDWGSWKLGGGLTQPVFKLTNITAGNFDSYLTSWAQAAASYKKPFFIRFDPEMNGSWLPWGTLSGVNGNNPADFVPAWRHVVDIFNAQGATNVTWVWCPNYVNTSSQTPLLSDLYPGDAYADWTCFDVYNNGTDKGNNSWRSFTQLSQNTYNYLLSFAPNKPIMIGEIGTSKDKPASDTDLTHTKPNWITSLIGSELPNTFPKIKALVWFNWDDDNPTLDWPIEGNSYDLNPPSPASPAPIDQASINAFAQAISSPYYAANDFATLTDLTKIQPLAVSSNTAGDLDGNGKVDIFDYNILLTNFGKSGPGILGDIDNSGKVDIFDYNLLLTNFGK